jgi:arylsulfatase A-like enzyme
MPMKAIMVMFDSLNRHMLPPYGCDWTVAPNFKRLAERTAVFDNAYVGSMPCMPARRELHTGRYNFLHRSWGPLEPFDESMPEILKNNGIYTHLVSDHYHYWEDGGCTYHNRYSSWEISRGQEGDAWKGHLPPIDIPEHIGARSGDWGRQDWVNRRYMPREEDQPQAKTFAMGLDFIHTNAAEDNWFLQIETFDPHEPFFTQKEYKDLYPHDYRGPFFDWPDYAPVGETPEQVQHLRFQYAALVSMCDAYLGKILDAMDEHHLWEDTLLIVNTDHGFLLSEHDWWGKVVMPFYNEIARMPLFIWDPRCRVCGERRSALVQTIDLAPTLLEYFGVAVPASMQGVPLKDTVAQDKPVRQAGLFGVHGGHVNLTDGHYVYMRAPVSEHNTPLYDYTLMPTHMRNPFRVEELQDIQLAEPFAFTRGCRLMKIDAAAWPNSHQFGTLLFDLDADPGQLHPIQDSVVEARLVQQMIALMKANDAPPEQFQRLGLA